MDSQPYRRANTDPGSLDMLWHASSEPQRQTLCGFAGMPSYVGRPIDVTASEKPNLGERRT